MSHWFGRIKLQSPQRLFERPPSSDRDQIIRGSAAAGSFKHYVCVYGRRRRSESLNEVDKERNLWKSRSGGEEEEEEDRDWDWELCGAFRNLPL